MWARPSNPFDQPPAFPLAAPVPWAAIPTPSYYMLCASPSVRVPVGAENSLYASADESITPAEAGLVAPAFEIASGDSHQAKLVSPVRVDAAQPQPISARSPPDRMCAQPL